MQTQKQSAVANGRHHHAASGAAQKLRNQICCDHDLSFLMEAHDGLSGAIAERAGFPDCGPRPLDFVLPRLSRRQRSVLDPAGRSFERMADSTAIRFWSTATAALATSTMRALRHGSSSNVALAALLEDKAFPR